MVDLAIVVTVLVQKYFGVSSKGSLLPKVEGGDFAAGAIDQHESPPSNVAG